MENVYVSVLFVQRAALMAKTSVLYSDGYRELHHARGGHQASQGADLGGSTIPWSVLLPIITCCLS